MFTVNWLSVKRRFLVESTDEMPTTQRRVLRAEVQGIRKFVGAISAIANEGKVPVSSPTSANPQEDQGQLSNAAMPMLKTRGLTSLALFFTGVKHRKNRESQKSIGIESKPDGNRDPLVARRCDCARFGRSHGIAMDAKARNPGAVSTNEGLINDENKALVNWDQFDDEMKEGTGHREGMNFCLSDRVLVCGPVFFGPRPGRCDAGGDGAVAPREDGASKKYGQVIRGVWI